MRGVIAGSSIDGIATRTVVEKVVSLAAVQRIVTVLSEANRCRRC